MCIYNKTRVGSIAYLCPICPNKISKRWVIIAHCVANRQCFMNFILKWIQPCPFCAFDIMKIGACQWQRIGQRLLSNSNYLPFDMKKHWKQLFLNLIKNNLKYPTNMETRICFAIKITIIKTRHVDRASDWDRSIYIAFPFNLNKGSLFCSYIIQSKWSNVWIHLLLYCCTRWDFLKNE